MPIVQTVFSQLMDTLPLYEFRKCVTRYKGNHKVQTFSCLDQFLCMAFAQLTYRESLRDIETCLRSMKPKLYHMGIRGRVSRSTLADANENRDWRIYADFAQVLISIARPLYTNEPLGIELDQTVYVLDASVIDLCLSLFPWASFRQTKSAIKLHTLMDLRGNIPVFIHISEGRLHDVNWLDDLPVEPGSIYVMDRGYLDFARLFSLHQQHAIFVIRAKGNLEFRRLYSTPVDKAAGVQCDQRIVLTGYYSSQGYPEQLRRIRIFDACDYGCQVISRPMAGGVILQMDQAASPHQGVLRHIRQCSQDANLDRHLGVCFGRYPEKAFAIGTEFVQHSPDFEYHHFRETAAYRSLFRSASCGTGEKR